MKNAYCSEDRFCFYLNTSWSMRLREFLRKIFKKEKILKEEIIFGRIFMANSRWFNRINKNTTNKKYYVYYDIEFYTLYFYKTNIL